MDYQVFALKWRPQDFDQIVGQDHVVSLLKNSIQKGRLAYAYLFSGPRGVGKTSCARILAKSLNCQKGLTTSPCQVCVPCKEVTQCHSLDVLEIDGASNRGIDEVRALRESVKFSPSSNRFKIYIIDEVHMLTNEAFNALLKTLEEPPEFVKFIFATTQVNRVPATILSRCQRLDFRRITVVEIISQLKRIIVKEKIRLDEEVLFAIARASDGSLRDAESLLDQLVSFTKDKISVSDVSSLLGVIEQEMLFNITEKIIKKDASGALELLYAMLRQGKDSNIILNNIIEHFRNLIIAKISQQDAYLIDLPAEIIKGIFDQGEHFSLEELFAMFNLLVNTQEMSKKMDSSIIPLEINLIRLIQEKKKTISSPDEKTSSQQNVKDDRHDASNGKSNLEDNDLREHWPKIIENLSKIKMSVATFLSEGIPLKVEGDVLTISFPDRCSLHKETLQKKENKLLIEKTLSQLFEKDLKVKFVSLPEAEEKKDKKKDSSDSFIHSAINAFNAHLL